MANISLLKTKENIGDKFNNYLNIFGNSDNNAYYIQSENASLKELYVFYAKYFMSPLALVLDINFSSTTFDVQFDDLISSLRSFLIAYLASVKSIQLNYNLLENLNPSEIRLIITYFPELEFLLNPYLDNVESYELNLNSEPFSMFNVINIFFYQSPILIIINNYHLATVQIQDMCNVILDVKSEKTYKFMTYSYEKLFVSNFILKYKFCSVQTQNVKLDVLKEGIDYFFKYKVINSDLFVDELFLLTNGDLFQMLEKIYWLQIHNDFTLKGNHIFWTFLNLKNLLDSQRFEQYGDNFGKEILFVFYVYNTRLSMKNLRDIMRMDSVIFEEQLKCLLNNNILFESEGRIDFFNIEVKHRYIKFVEAECSHIRQNIYKRILEDSKLFLLFDNSLKISFLSILNKYVFRYKYEWPLEFCISNFLEFLTHLERESKYNQLYHILKFVQKDLLLKQNCFHGYIKDILFFKSIVLYFLKNIFYARQYLFFAISVEDDLDKDSFYILKLVTLISRGYDSKGMLFLLPVILSWDCKFSLSKNFKYKNTILIKLIVMTLFNNIFNIFYKDRSSTLGYKKMCVYQKIVEIIPQYRQSFLISLCVLRYSFFVNCSDNVEQKILAKYGYILMFYKSRLNYFGKQFALSLAKTQVNFTIKPNFLKLIFFDFFLLDMDLFSRKMFFYFQKFKELEDTTFSNASFLYYTKSLFYSGVSVDNVLDFFVKYKLWSSNHYLFNDYEISIGFYEYLVGCESNQFFHFLEQVPCKKSERGIYFSNRYYFFKVLFFQNKFDLAIKCGADLKKMIYLVHSFEYFEFKFFYCLSLGIYSIQENKKMHIAYIRDFICELKRLCLKNKSALVKIQILKCLQIMINKKTLHLFSDLELLAKHPNMLYSALAEEVYFYHFKRLKMFDMAKKFLYSCLEKYQKLNIQVKIAFFKQTERDLFQFIGTIGELSFSQEELLSTINNNILLSKIVDQRQLVFSFFHSIKMALEASYIALLEPESEDILTLVCELSYDYGPKYLNRDLRDFSTRLPVDVIHYAKNTCQVFHSSDHGNLAVIDSLSKFNVHGNFVCFPIIDKEKTIAILYLEKKVGEFDSYKDIKLLELMSSQYLISHKSILLKKQNKELIDELEIKVSQQVNHIRKADIEMQKSRELAQKASAQSAYATLTRGIAHEIRNPMAMILSGAELILDNLSNKDMVVKYMNALKSSIVRLKNVTNSMLNYGHPVSSKRVNVDLNAVIDDTLIMCAGECKKRHIRIKAIFNHTKIIYGESNSISQALLNVILNSIQAIERKGVIEIETQDDQFFDSNQLLQEGVCIKVKDNGPGIPKDKIDRIFDPFFSTKYGNAGLGMSIVFKTLNVHNGHISVKSVEGKFTIVMLYFPFTQKN